MTLLFTIFIGLTSVIQAGMNRQMAVPWGLPSTLLLNAVMFLVAAVLYYVTAKFSGFSLPIALQEKAGFQNWSWWYFIPGYLGFLFVVGVPYAMARIGALQVFVGLVVAQIVGGLIWDKWIEGLDWSTSRLVGATLAIIAVVLASK